MGSDDGDPAEQPVHEVSLAGYCMDVTEVTVAAYTECATRGACQPAPDVDWNGNTRWCNGDRSDRQLHPVNCVDWSQADTYCRSVGKRLPTEEEWEHAARGDDGRKYPWGDAAPSNQLCWTGNGGAQSTCKVGSFPRGRSPYGLLDMAGNVLEWTSSGYSIDYTGPRDDADKVDRGGFWGHDPQAVRAAHRGHDPVANRTGAVGFRCARDM
jgi:formylglycine-generating enzyme required for sulfatase activity